MILNRIIILHGHYLRISFKNYTKVVLDRSESPVSSLDLSSREKINTVLLKNFIKMICCLIEKSSFNLSSIHVDEFDFHERPTRFCHPLIGFLTNACHNLPISRKRIQHLYRNVLNIVGIFATVKLWRSVFGKSVFVNLHRFFGWNYFRSPLPVSFANRITIKLLWNLDTFTQVITFLLINAIFRIFLLFEGFKQI